MNIDHNRCGKVSCLGGALADLIISQVNNYPQAKINTSIFVDNLAYSAGGGAVNSALALAKLGLKAAVFSRVGSDIFGEMIKSTLSDNSVDIKNIVTSATQHTSTVIVGVHQDTDRSFISYHGALSEYSLTDFKVNQLLDSNFLLCSDFFNLPKIDGYPLAELLAAARQRKVTTLLDATWGVLGLRRDLLEIVLPHLDYFLPSVDECRILYPNRTDDQLLDYFLSRGCKAVVIKRGRDGVIAADGSGRHQLDALKSAAEIVDSTGAGDNFNAGFLYGLQQNYNFFDCLKVGSVVAGHSILATGSWYSAAEIQAQIQQYFSGEKDAV